MKANKSESYKRYKWTEIRAKQNAQEIHKCRDTYIVIHRNPLKHKYRKHNIKAKGLTVKNKM